MPLFHIAEGVDISEALERLGRAVTADGCGDRVTHVRVVHGSQTPQPFSDAVLDRLVAILPNDVVPDYRYHSCLVRAEAGSHVSPGDAVSHAMGRLLGRQGLDEVLLVLVHRDLDRMHQILDDHGCQLAEKPSAGSVVVYHGQGQPGQLFA